MKMKSVFNFKTENTETAPACQESFVAAAKP
jgi:hypothetical protein